MAQFIQVGKMAYNLDHIQMVNMHGPVVFIWFSDHPETDGPTEIDGENAEAFRRWWASYNGAIHVDREPERTGPNWDELEGREVCDDPLPASLSKVRREGEGVGPDWDDSIVSPDIRAKLDATGQRATGGDGGSMFENPYPPEVQ